MEATLLDLDLELLLVVGLTDLDLLDPALLDLDRERLDATLLDRFDVTLLDLDRLDVAPE